MTDELTDEESYKILIEAIKNSAKRGEDTIIMSIPSELLSDALIKALKEDGSAS